MSHKSFGTIQPLISVCGVSVLLAVSCVALTQKNDVLLIQRTCRELRAYTLPDESTSEDREIPARMRLLQTRFKHQLRDLIVEELNEEAASISRPAPEMRSTIRQRLKALRLITRTKEHLPLFSFGHVLDVSVSRPPGHPDFLAVGLVIDASWDQDQSLYIFQHQSSGWVDVLAAEVNDYRQVYDAQSSRFNFALSPSSADGSWFLVTSSVVPHMASAWQIVTYTALAPGRDADHPKILVRRTHSIYLDREDEGQACRIRTTANGFRVSFRVGVSSESLSDERYSDEYMIANGAAKRIAVRCRTFDRSGKRVACDPR